jgi:hypothetical protein
MENPEKKQRKGSVFGRYSPPKDVLERAKQMAPSVIAFDWSPHCNGDESPDQAKNRHFSELRAAHGDSWTYKKHPDHLVHILLTSKFTLIRCGTTVR